MKKILPIILLLFGPFSFAQVAPTLGVGLETLTMNKGTIDVKVLTEIIMEKQRELKQEALKRFMFKMFPESNYTTKFYVQNCLNILLNEKNPQVIEKEILELTTNYALALGVTQALIKSDDKIFDNLNLCYKEQIDTINFETEIEKLKKQKILEKKDSRIGEKYKRINDEANKLEKDIREGLKKPKNTILDNLKNIKRKKNTLDRKKTRLSNIKFRYKLNDTIISNAAENKIIVPFGLLLDVVSLSLSENENVTKKGFFKNKIDYRQDDFYRGLTWSKESYTLEELNKLPSIINKKINPYIKDYDVIKEFLEKNKIEDRENKIKDILIGSTFNQAILFFDNKNEDWFDKFIKSESNEKAKKNITEIKSLNLKIESVKTEMGSNIEKLKVFEKEKKNLEDLINEIKVKLDSGNIETIAKLQIPKTLADFKINAKINTLNENLKKYNVENSEDILSEIDEIKTFFDSVFSSLKNEIENDNILCDKSKDDYKKQITSEIESLLTNSKSFSAEYINSNSILLIKTITSINKTKAGNELKFELKDTVTINKISKIIPELYAKLKNISNNKSIRINDIIEFEKFANEKILELKILDYTNSHIYDSIQDDINKLIPVFKLHLFNELPEDFKYQPELSSLFEFISNLDNLDKAQTYESIINLLKEYSEKVEEELPNSKFKDSYKIFINGMKKYTLINPTAEKQYVEIDIVSFINDLQQFYNRNNPSRFSLYLTLGLNQNMFFEDFKFPDPVNDTIKNISFASEKIGIKWKFHDFKKYRGYENVIKDDVYLNKRAPFVNEFYGIVYGSGLLYSLANTSTNENFDFPHVGLGVGIRFYNALDVNLILGFPFVKGSNFGDNAFCGIGLDIPLGEYLEKLGNKN